METIVGEKRRSGGRGVGMIVVRKLADGHPRNPIIMHGRDIGTKNLLVGTVDDFGVAIGLRVEGSGDVELGTQS